MNGAEATWLNEGTRMHMHHGPIDLVIGADGPASARDIAFRAGWARFQSVLPELVAELPVLRHPADPYDPVVPQPESPVGRRMGHAVSRFAGPCFITPMAAVAGSVADEIRDAMLAVAPGLTRLYVNNGGDIALHLTEGQQFRIGMASLGDQSAQMDGVVDLTRDDGIRGIATSGRRGRSLSLGIADSVTVLANNAAMADAAATLIANAVDLPGHPAVQRERAEEHDPDSDLAGQVVVVDVGPLSAPQIAEALASGRARADKFIKNGLIRGASLLLQGQVEICGSIAPKEIAAGSPSFRTDEVA